MAQVTSRLDFRILGPLMVRVDGATVPIGGPKQRALLALLLLSANRVVPRDRLMQELFAEETVASADHALRNHVSRLRKGLAVAGDDARLVARPPGYLLRVEPGELDLDRFERLVASGREAYTKGDARAAVAAFREAASLWHGRPLADLELEPFARVDVERLDELRLAATEERIDAELALGGHRAVVAELETLAAEHPYRERFRAQLMLALYRCGRQAEGLQVYRQTRTLLRGELGLEPGTELQELERAILGQDPRLAVATVPDRLAPRRELCPYKGLAPFEQDDADLFHGRERLVEELVGRLEDAPLLAVVGASGSGKSSLLRAGLLPALGAPPGVVVRPSTCSAAELAERLAQDQPSVVAVDQFEELFASQVGVDERRRFIHALVDAAWDADRRRMVLLALRADFFGQLAEHPELAELVGANHVLLGPMTPSELRRAIEQPARHAGIEVEPALAEALIDDGGREAGALPLVSTALLELWRASDRRTLTHDAYERSGGLHGAVARHAEAAFQALAPEEQSLARRILLRLVDGGDGEALTRRRARIAEFRLGEDGRALQVIAELVERRLVVADAAGVELVHEALLVQWPRLAAWVDEDAHGRRLHRHLAQAAAEWEASGRDPAELYRGARLAAALEWADGADLSVRERGFLRASRIAFARANRRLRMMLALTLVLLAAAVVAGAVALAERSAASSQATAAIAQRLGAQALVEPRLDRALLLAREGVAIDDRPDTRSNLLAALLRATAALAIAHGSGERVIDTALSGDGRTLAARGDDGQITFFDTRTLRKRRVGARTPGQNAYFGAVPEPIRALAFSPDGRMLAAGDSDGNHGTLALIDVVSGGTRATEPSPSSAVVTDVAYAPSGRELVTAEAVSGRISPPPGILVRRRVGDGAALRTSRAIPAARLAGYVNRGLQLLVVAGGQRSLLLNSRTLAQVRELPIGGVAAVAPDGMHAAFGHEDGGVELVDIATGARTPMDRRATGRVRGVAFSRNSALLATAADDDSVAVWDARRARLIERYTGHAAASRGVAFSPDGATLYSGSDDGTVIAWDVRGTRRLARPFHVSDGQPSTAVAVSPDAAGIAVSPEPGRVTVIRARDLRPVRVLRGPFGAADSVAFSHDGKLLVAGGDGPSTVVWSLGSGRMLATLGPAGEGGVTGVAVSPDDRLVATAGVDGTARLYDLRTRRLVGHPTVKGSLQDVDFSPDGSLLVAAGLAGEVLIWDVHRRMPLHTIHHHDAVLAVRFSPDGRRIATGDLPGNVEFWEPATGRRAGPTLHGQNGLALSVSFDPSGEHVATTSSDGNLRLWDVTSGKLVGAPLAASDTGGWGTFAPDGKWFVAVFDTGDGVVWEVDPSAWIALACRVAHRNLTRSEWRDFLPERRYGRVCR